MDENTSVHIAFDENDRMVGMIETNSETDQMINGNIKTANIGEIFVVDSLRKTGLSDALFCYAANYEKAKGIQCLWVEHGTANPNGRRFWNHYFDNYQCELDRIIEKI